MSTSGSSAGALSHRVRSESVTCSIIGARGYSGLELAKLLLHHPKAKLTHCFATSDFQLSASLTQEAAKTVLCLKDSEIMNHLTDVVFMATPAEVSLNLAPQILAAGKKVIDLSGAFRLKKSDYKKWYGFEHTESATLGEAVYGLAPWAGPSKGESLVANPGCYATAINMALIPVLKVGLVNTGSIVIDAKSGTTGAGKKAVESQLFAEVDGECLPYKVGRHQHYPEIIEAVEAFSGATFDAHMTTSLLPVRRGIIAGIYAQLHDGGTLENVKAAYAEAYATYPFVTHGGLNDEPALASLKKVVGTGRTHISYEVVGSKLYLFSCLDNLMKGAASQAVENFNRMNDLPLSMGLDHLEALI